MTKKRRLHWNARCPRCVNCSSDGHDRRANGFCAQCSPAAQKLRVMRTWDRDDPETWSGCALRGRTWFADVGITAQDYFDQAKSMLENELDNRRRLEAQVHGDEPIDSVLIEYALIELGRIVKIPHPDHYRGWAGIMDHFGREERRLIYGFLQDFIMNRPRSSFWVRAYHAAFRRKDYNRRREERRLEFAERVAGAP